MTSQLVARGSCGGAVANSTSRALGATPNGLNSDLPWKRRWLAMYCSHIRAARRPWWLRGVCTQSGNLIAYILELCTTHRPTSRQPGLPVLELGRNATVVDECGRRRGRSCGAEHRGGLADAPSWHSRTAVVHLPVHNEGAGRLGRGHRSRLVQNLHRCGEGALERRRRRHGRVGRVAR